VLLVHTSIISFCNLPVNIYIVSPAHKPRLVSKLILQATKHILGNGAAPSPVSKILDDVREGRPPKVNVLDLIKIDLPPVPRGGLTHNAEYYRNESEGGFVVFRLEDTLLKVFNIRSSRRNSADDHLHFLPGGAEALIVLTRTMCRHV
jgi:hypothetical protein